MKRLFLFACFATAVNGTIAGCAAQQSGTPNYSTVVTDTSAAATLIDGIAGILAGQNTAAVAPVAASEAK
jgi:hypothetical protein